jgi:hypothetical protein
MATPNPTATLSCPANIRETKIAFGFIPQADLTTENTPAEIWSLLKTNTDLMTLALATETDALDIGKGDEFPTQVFPTSASTTVPLQKYCTSEFMAWLFCFGLGKATGAAAGTGFHYDATPQDPASGSCINLPAFTWAEQIRPSPNSVVDRAAIGMVVNDFTITMESGPGRNNCRVAANFIGTGQVAAPSGLTFPANTPEHLLNANGVTVLTVNGIDYMLGGNFVSLEFAWNNNVNTTSGYYPGSGAQNGFGIRGRMEFGTRSCTFRFVARAQKGSQEFLNLINLTEGPTTVTVKGAAIDASNFNDMTISCPRTMISADVTGEQDGVVTVNCEVAILKPTDGVTPYITLSATTTKGNIFGV